MSARDAVTHLDCPRCGTPALPGTWVRQQQRYAWSEDDDEVACPGCGVQLRVSVTDDYADDAVASAEVVEVTP